MKILIHHPSIGGNLGDRVILEGTERLLSWAYEDFEVIYSNRIYDPREIDLFVMAGTPWIWDMCDRSDKYRQLEEIIESLPVKTKRVALGLGSCLPLASNSSVYIFGEDPIRERTRATLVDIYSRFDFISTRDRWAYFILKLLNIDIHKGLCPAIHFIDQKDWRQDPTHPVLVFINPSTSISAVSCDHIFSQDLLGFQKQFYQEYAPKVLLMDKSDIEWCEHAEWHYQLVESTSELVRELHHAKFVVSGRVHAAIPARLLGLQTFILPLDSRYLTAVKCGAIPVLTSGLPDFSKYLHSGDDYDPIPPTLIALDKKYMVKRLQELFN